MTQIKICYFRPYDSKNMHFWPYIDVAKMCLGCQSYIAFFSCLFTICKIYLHFGFSNIRSETYISKDVSIWIRKFWFEPPFSLYYFNSNQYFLVNFENTLPEWIPLSFSSFVDILEIFFVRSESEMLALIPSVKSFNEFMEGRFNTLKNITIWVFWLKKFGKEAAF